MLRADGLAMQRAWGCRRGGYRPEHSPEHAGRRAEVLAGACKVLRMTPEEGAEAFDGGCPRAVLYQPHMAEVAKLHRWWKARSLPLYVPYPSEAMLEAIDAVEDGVRAYEDELIEEAKRKASKVPTPPR